MSEPKRIDSHFLIWIEAFAGAVALALTVDSRTCCVPGYQSSRKLDQKGQ